MVSKKWRSLQAGDVVDVIAPGYPTTPEAVEGARQFLLNWGLQPRIPKNILGRHFMHAQEDEVRLEHLESALIAEDSAAVWCLRGGYGSLRLLPGLAKLKKPARTKLFVGISDITSLHVFLNQKWGWSTVHGPLLDRLGAGRVSKQLEGEVRRLVFGKQETIKFEKLRPLNSAALQLKSVKAPIVGGNLTVLQSTLGTPWQFDTKGKFLFVEDLGERGYRIDRILEQFRQAGLFKSCRGLLIGHFLGGGEGENKPSLIPKVFDRWASDLNLPVFDRIPAGHDVLQRPLPLGPVSVLRGGKSGSLEIQSGGIFL